MNIGTTYSAPGDSSQKWDEILAEVQHSRST
jgi:hypothetical protein